MIHIPDLHRTLAVILLSSVLTVAQASENGSINWPLGVNTVLPALLPPPGDTSLYSYTVYYSADEYRGNNGSNAGFDFKLGNFAQALRVVHTWDRETDSGLRVSSGVILSGGRLSLDMVGTSDTDSGLNQLYVTPLYLTWSPTPELHLLTGFSAFIPVGNYDRNDMANLSNNYYSYVQEFGATWMPTRQWEFSVSPTMSFNVKNEDTSYRSGNVFHVDYNIGYWLRSMPNLQLGLAGYVTQQLSDDELYGQDVPGGNRLRKVAIGPQLFYAFNQSSGIVFKWLHETSVKNGPKGHALWMQFALPI